MPENWWSTRDVAWLSFSCGIGGLAAGAGLVLMALRVWEASHCLVILGVTVCR